MAKRPPRSKGFGEAQAGFDTASEIDLIFAAYGYRCAFTGASLKGLNEADAGASLVRLYSTQSPQFVHRDLVIPGVAEIANAFRNGHIAIGPHYNFLLDWSRIDRDLASRLNDDGHLRLPPEEFFPNRDALREHRDMFSSGRLSAN